MHELVSAVNGRGSETHPPPPPTPPPKHSITEHVQRKTCAPCITAVIGHLYALFRQTITWKTREGSYSTHDGEGRGRTDISQQRTFITRASQRPLPDLTYSCLAHPFHMLHGETKASKLAKNDQQGAKKKVIPDPNAHTSIHVLEITK